MNIYDLSVKDISIPDLSGTNRGYLQEFHFNSIFTV